MCGRSAALFCFVFIFKGHVYGGCRGEVKGKAGCASGTRTSYPDGDVDHPGPNNAGTERYAGFSVAGLRFTGMIYPSG